MGELLPFRVHDRGASVRIDDASEIRPRLCFEVSFRQTCVTLFS